MQIYDIATNDILANHENAKANSEYREKDMSELNICILRLNKISNYFYEDLAD